MRSFLIFEGAHRFQYLKIKKAHLFKNDRKKMARNSSAHLIIGYRKI